MLDPRTKDTELEVQRIINLQQLANNLPDTFTNIRGVSKSYIPMANAPEKVEIPLEGMNSTQIPNPRKRGRDPNDSAQAKRGARKGKLLERTRYAPIQSSQQ